MELHVIPSKALFYNIWAYRKAEELDVYLAAIKERQFDVLCLTEVTNCSPIVITENETDEVFQERIPSVLEKHPDRVNALFRLQNLLGGRYDCRYDSPEKRDWVCKKTQMHFPEVEFGSALFTRKNLDIVDRGVKTLCQADEIQERGISPRALQYVVYDKGSFRYLVAHFHGVWIKDNTKGDDPVRTLQSIECLVALEVIATEYAVDKIVFGGDFNLAINTEALSFLKGIHGANIGPFRNMIEEHAVLSTRTKEYRKYDWPGESLHADYVFAGSNVSISRMCVDTKNDASDHAPVEVEFS